MKTLRLVSGALFSLVLASGCSGLSSGPRTTPQMATPRSVSPASIRPAPMARTAILPASAMNVRPQGAVQNLSFTQIPGAASAAAAAPDGSLWVLSTSPAGADKYIWHYVSGTWTNISGLASRLSVAPNGTLYAINSGGGTYSYSGGTWTALGGGASGVTTAADGSFYVLSNGGAGPDRAIWHNVGGTWSQVPGSGVSIAGSFDTGSYTLPGGTVSPGGLYIVNSLGAIYYENTNNSFVQLPANASVLAPTTVGGVFALGYPANAGGNSIYYYNLSTPGWSAQSGSGVSVSSNGGKLYVIASSGAIYVSTIRPTSGTIVEYSIPTANSGPYGITQGPDGNMWFTENNTGTNKVAKITPTGVITEYSLPTSNAFPGNIVSGPDGNLWYVDESNHLGRVTTGGTITLDPATDPSAVAVGSDNNLWVTEFNGMKVDVYSTAGALLHSYVSNTSPSNLQLEQITAGPDGNMWFDTFSGDNVVKMVTGTGATTAFVYTPTLQNTLRGITKGPDGNVWACAQDSNLIARITPAGTLTTFTIPSANAEPNGITTGSDGNLWFTEPGINGATNKIARITPSGTVTEVAIPTALSGPALIAAGPNNTIWFTEESSNKIGEIYL
jgi:streptogramin lyase